ncbi:hypothetical protein PNK_p0021 (plasmid) [Candidatus Protochlamydia naegleriophila]|uniref:Uncharacterized protein n=1 Tax=Candidatus Protochlamydia naegleriophila TaxID=389348 RepID=A0A0U5K7B7_9BACT|nr:hypothetical protein [Candidatus Protochlamydia naegleriophila]CUI18075.1 hypothetical protein PNK_p0021 [Candidatus Protochlamydia naegleriophila]
MFEENYLTRLSNNSFNNNTVCLGRQVVEIIEFLEDFLPSLIWYGSDISITANADTILLDEKFTLYTPTKIGTSYDFKKESDKVVQFLSGVFIASEKKILWPNNLKIGTEDLFRPIEMNDIILEIRAFDTSYFEVYSDDYELIKKIATHYKSEIESTIKEI